MLLRSEEAVLHGRTEQNELAIGRPGAGSPNKPLSSSITSSGGRSTRTVVRSFAYSKPVLLSCACPCSRRPLLLRIVEPRDSWSSLDSIDDVDFRIRDSSCEIPARHNTLVCTHRLSRRSSVLPAETAVERSELRKKKIFLLIIEKKRNNIG